MRLETRQKTGLLNVLERLPHDAEAFLFGSRTDDTKRGGDVDLLVVVPEGTDRNALTLAVLRNYQEVSDDRLDVVVASAHECATKPFLQHIRPTCIPLCVSMLS